MSNDTPTKRCSKCHEIKESICFTRETKSPDGLSGYCRQCKSEYAKAYRAANGESLQAKQHEKYISNIEAMREAGRLYYARNRESRVEYSRRYKSENKEAIAKRRSEIYFQNHEKSLAYSREQYRSNRERKRQYSLKYYHQNKEKRAEYSRVYRTANKEKIRVRVRAYYWENKEKERVRGIDYRRRNPEKVRAKNHRRRQTVAQAIGTFTPEETRDLFKRQKGKCYYCQCKLINPDTHKGTGEKAHLDHVVPLKRGGRNDISNLVWACAFCNASKGSKLVHEWRGNHGRLI